MFAEHIQGPNSGCEHSEVVGGAFERQSDRMASDMDVCLKQKYTTEFSLCGKVAPI